MSPSRLGVAALLAAIFAFTAAASTAHAEEGPAVLFSYEKYILGNDVQYVLVPRPSRMKLDTRAPTSPAVLNGLFNELKNRKRATYGSTSLEVTAATLKRGQATVKVDPSKKRYFVIIAAEVIHTLSGFGVDKVSFPGHARKAMGPDDVAFGVFDLRIPAWRVLPPRRVSRGTVALPGGGAMEAAAFYKAIAKKDEAITKMADAYLANDDQGIVLTTIRALPELKIPGWEDKVMPLLKHKDKKVRMAALDALEGNEGEEVLAAIGKVMDKDRDADVTQRAAAVLGKSKNKKYAVFALYHQMRGKDEAAALDAISKIVKMKEPSAAEELTRTARAKRAKPALAAIDALGSLGAVEKLVELFGDKKLEAPRRLAAADEVVDLKDGDARFAALSFIATDGEPDKANAAIDALASIKDPDPRTRIEAALNHKSSRVRRHAGEVLAGIKDPASLKPMAKAAAAHDEDVEALQTSASKIMGKLSLNDVLGYTTNRNIVLRRVAYEALGAKAKGGNRRVLDVLGKGIKDKDEGIRAASAKALIAFKDDKALKLLLGAGDDKSADVRRNVARSLSNWPAGKVNGRELLAGYLSDKDPRVVAAAVDTLRARQESETFSQVLALYKSDRHPDADVRAATLKAIHVLANDKQKQSVISVLSGGIYDKDHDVKMLAIELLGNYDNAAAVTGLASMINDPRDEYRLASLDALGKTQSEDAVELIASVINDPKKSIRLAAVTALGDNGTPAAADELKKHMKRERDVEVLKAAKRALKKIK